MVTRSYVYDRLTAPRLMGTDNQPIKPLAVTPLSRGRNMLWFPSEDRIPHEVEIRLQFREQGYLVSSAAPAGQWLFKVVYRKWQAQP